MLTGQNFSILYVNISLYNIQIYKYIYILGMDGIFQKNGRKMFKKGKIFEN